MNFKTPSKEIREAPYSHLDQAIQMIPGVLKVSAEIKELYNQNIQIFSPEQEKKFSRDGALFLEPNEQQPKDSLAQLKKSPPGTGYWSVGSERGFIGAALNRSSFLVLTDFSKGVFVFNNINIMLLKISNNREDYLNLRLYAPIEIWRLKVKPHYPSLSENSLQTLYLFWTQMVRRELFGPGPISRGLWGFPLLHLAPNEMARPAFDQVNYLYYDEPFIHLKNLVNQSKILSFLADLTSVGDLKGIVQDLKKNKVQMGVFDFSNAIGAFELTTSAWKTLSLLRSVAHPNAIILNTTLSENCGWNVGNQKDPEMMGLIWDYQSTPIHSIPVPQPKMSKPSKTPPKNCPLPH